MRNGTQAISLQENIAAMYVLQGAGYVIPFFTLPFLVRMLGSTGFGLLAISQAVMMLLVMFVDSGFNQSASRNIAVNRDNPGRISEIFWSTQIIRIVLSVAGSVVLACIVFLVEEWRDHWHVFLAQGLMLLGAISMPAWYFSGMERMKQVATYSIVARLLSAIAIFSVVRGPQDVVLAAACQAAATLVTGLAVHWRILRHELPWRAPGKHALTTMIKTGRSLFASEFVAGVAGSSNVLLLGAFASTEAAGVYAAIDKMMRAVESMVFPILTAFSPRVTRIYAASPIEAPVICRRLTAGIAFVALPLSGILILEAPSVMTFLFGVHLGEFDDALRGMSIWLFLRCINLALIEFYFIAPGRFYSLSRLLMITVTLQVLLGVCLTHTWGLAGMVTAAIATETTVLVLAWCLFKLNPGRKEPSA